MVSRFAMVLVGYGEEDTDFYKVPFGQSDGGGGGVAHKKIIWTAAL